MSTENTFTIDTDEIFELVKERSALKAEVVGDIDKFAITTDHKNWYEGVLENAAAKLFKLLSSDAQGIDDAYDFDVTTDMNINIIVTQPTYWDENMLTPFLRLMIEYLVNHVLMDWWKMRNLPDEQLKAKADLRETEIELSDSKSMRTTRPRITQPPLFGI